MNVTFPHRIALGLCPACGERPPAKDRYKCFQCNRKNAEDQKKRRSGWKVFSGHERRLRR